LVRFLLARIVILETSVYSGAGAIAGSGMDNEMMAPARQMTAPARNAACIPGTSWPETMVSAGPAAGPAIACIAIVPKTATPNMAPAVRRVIIMAEATPPPSAPLRRLQLPEQIHRDLQKKTIPIIPKTIFNRDHDRVFK
jgi:hypothetical protein